VSLFEIVAAALGIISVYFSSRQIVLAWPTSLLNNTMYGVIFFEQKLYALMALQGCFFVIAVYGWYQWLFGGAAKTKLNVTRIPLKLGALLALLTLAGTLLIWFTLHHHTDDPNPLIDGFFFAVSLTAQWMMARKYFECWPVWVTINCVAVPFFLLHRSYPTMVQYAVFLVLAIMGTRNWWKSLQEGRQQSTVNS